MKYPFLWLVTVSLLLVIAVTPQAAPAAEKSPSISSIRLREGNGSVLLSAELDAQLNEELREAVRGGVPLTFRYRVRLTRRGSILGEKNLRTEELTHVLQYNPVKQIFLFSVDGYGPSETKETKDEEEAFWWMMNITDWPLYPLDQLQHRYRYKVRVMATLRSVELPSVLGYLFFFTTIFNTETGWEEVDFRY
jgi:hypothetical protein